MFILPRNLDTEKNLNEVRQLMQHFYYSKLDFNIIFHRLFMLHGHKYKIYQSLKKPHFFEL